MGNERQGNYVIGKIRIIRVLRITAQRRRSRIAELVGEGKEGRSGVACKKAEVA